MERLLDNQRINLENSQLSFYQELWIEAFYRDRLAGGLSRHTIKFYSAKLQHFNAYCKTKLIREVTQLTPDTLREYLLYLADLGHNPGGINASYRVIKTFLIWFENETELEGWKNPIRKVKSPRVVIEPLDPADPAIISRLVDTCDKHTIIGARDQAIFLALLDTGCRAREFLAINKEDLDTITGAIVLRQTKAKKPRTVYLGKRSRKAIRMYLSMRKDNNPALWVNRYGDRVVYMVLREMVRRRANQAKVVPPALHSFRRLFALTMLRNGVDIYSIQRLLGHSDLTVLMRYLKETDGDLQRAHELGSPTDVLKSVSPFH